ncbi:MAG: ATP-binding cassette domain-containing protein [Saprospiraceae bacterium]
MASIIQQTAASQKDQRVSRHRTFYRNPGDKVLPLKGEIKFENVDFVYPDTGIQALKDVGFHLKSGQKMAIIGKTGSGKTTIADLLVRMYDITGGKNPARWQQHQRNGFGQFEERVGYVPQDVFLFSDTISSNVAFGKEAELAEIESFAKYAAVYGDIVDLPNKFDTLVGEEELPYQADKNKGFLLLEHLSKSPISLFWTTA